MNKNEEISRLQEVLYMNFNDFYNQEIREVAFKLVKYITSGNSIRKNRFKRALIDSYKFLSEVEYLEKNYVLCLKYIKQLQLCEVYSNETEETVLHATIRRFQCEIYLAIYQADNEKVKMLHEKLKDFGYSFREKLEFNLKEDYDKALDLSSSILNNSVKTIVNFELPYKIDIPENEQIVYSFNGITFSLKFKSLSNKEKVEFEVQNGIIELEKDKYGIYSYSDLTVTINSFFDATHKIDELLDLCSDAFNYFLDYYKIITDYYWIDNLNLKQIQASNVRVISENFDDIISIPFYYAHGVNISTSPSYIDEEKLNCLKRKLTEKQSPQLWEVLYSDSKNNIFIERYKEAIISINAAFENYLNIRSREILKIEMSDQEVENYLHGIPSYETYFLSDFISEEDFNNALEKNIISPYSPSTFQIIKKCFDVGGDKISISKSKLNKLVNTIRKNRNDIIHGNLNLIKSVESDAKKSIKAFEEFIKVF